MKVMAKYWPRGRGNKKVIGGATKTQYGLHGQGQVFAVEVDDIAAQPSIWLCPESDTPFIFKGDSIKCPEWEGKPSSEIIIPETDGIKISGVAGQDARQSRLRRGVEERERLLVLTGNVEVESKERMEAGITAEEDIKAKLAENSEDLTVVAGVGRKTQATLNENGIYTVDTFSGVGNKYLQKMEINPRIIGRIRDWFDSEWEDWKVANQPDDIDEPDE